MTKKVYLANPYGFSLQQRNILLLDLIEAIEAVDPSVEVWEPFERNDQNRDSACWAWETGQENLHDVRACDAIFAVVNGCPPDEGVMVELGIAIALGRPIFLFRDDFRRCSDSDAYPLNLMVFTGLPKIGWEGYYYTNIQHIADPQGAFARWARQ